MHLMLAAKKITALFVIFTFVFSPSQYGFAQEQVATDPTLASQGVAIDKPQNPDLAAHVAQTEQSEQASYDNVTSPLSAATPENQSLEDVAQAVIERDFKDMEGVTVELNGGHTNSGAHYSFVVKTEDESSHSSDMNYYYDASGSPVHSAFRSEEILNSLTNSYPSASIYQNDDGTFTAEDYSSYYRYSFDHDGNQTNSEYVSEYDPAYYYDYSYYYDYASDPSHYENTYAYDPASDPSYYDPAYSMYNGYSSVEEFANARFPGKETHVEYTSGTSPNGTYYNTLIFNLSDQTVLALTDSFYEGEETSVEEFVAHKIRHENPMITDVYPNGNGGFIGQYTYSYGYYYETNFIEYNDRGIQTNSWSEQSYDESYYDSYYSDTYYNHADIYSFNIDSTGTNDANFSFYISTYADLTLRITDQYGNIQSETSVYCSGYCNTNISGLNSGENYSAELLLSDSSSGYLSGSTYTSFQTSSYDDTGYYFRSPDEIQMQDFSGQNTSVEYNAGYSPNGNYYSFNIVNHDTNETHFYDDYGNWVDVITAEENTLVEVVDTEFDQAVEKLPVETDQYPVIYKTTLIHYECSDSPCGMNATDSYYGADGTPLGSRNYDNTLDETTSLIGSMWYDRAGELIDLDRIRGMVEATEYLDEAKRAFKPAEPKHQIKHEIRSHCDEEGNCTDVMAQDTIEYYDDDKNLLGRVEVELWNDNKKTWYDAEGNNIHLAPSIEPMNLNNNDITLSNGNHMNFNSNTGIAIIRDAQGNETSYDYVKLFELSGQSCPAEGECDHWSADMTEEMSMTMKQLTQLTFIRQSVNEDGSYSISRILVYQKLIIGELASNLSLAEDTQSQVDAAIQNIDGPRNYEINHNDNGELIGFSWVNKNDASHSYHLNKAVDDSGNVSWVFINSRPIVTVPEAVSNYVSELENVLGDGFRFEVVARNDGTWGVYGWDNKNYVIQPSSGLKHFKFVLDASASEPQYLTLVFHSTESENGIYLGGEKAQLINEAIASLFNNPYEKQSVAYLARNLDNMATVKILSAEDARLEFEIKKYNKKYTVSRGQDGAIVITEESILPPAVANYVAALKDQFRDDTRINASLQEDGTYLVTIDRSFQCPNDMMCTMVAPAPGSFGSLSFKLKADGTRVPESIDADYNGVMVSGKNADLLFAAMNTCPQGVICAQKMIAINPMVHDANTFGAMASVSVSKILKNAVYFTKDGKDFRVYSDVERKIILEEIKKIDVPLEENALIKNLFGKNAAYKIESWNKSFISYFDAEGNLLGTKTILTPDEQTTVTTWRGTQGNTKQIETTFVSESETQTTIQDHLGRLIKEVIIYNWGDRYTYIHSYAGDTQVKSETLWTNHNSEGILGNESRTFYKKDADGADIEIIAGRDIYMGINPPDTTPVETIDYYFWFSRITSDENSSRTVTSFTAREMTEENFLKITAELSMSAALQLAALKTVTHFSDTSGNYDLSLTYSNDGSLDWDQKPLVQKTNKDGTHMVYAIRGEPDSPIGSGDDILIKYNQPKISAGGKSYYANWFTPWGIQGSTVGIYFQNASTGESVFAGFPKENRITLDSVLYEISVDNEGVIALKQMIQPFEISLPASTNSDQNTLKISVAADGTATVIWNGSEHIGKFDPDTKQITVNIKSRPYYKNDDYILNHAEKAVEPVDASYTPISDEDKLAFTGETAMLWYPYYESKKTWTLQLSENLNGVLSFQRTETDGDGYYHSQSTTYYNSMGLIEAESWSTSYYKNGFSSGKTSYTYILVSGQQKLASVISHASNNDYPYYKYPIEIQPYENLRPIEKPAITNEEIDRIYKPDVEYYEPIWRPYYPASKSTTKTFYAYDASGSMTQAISVTSSTVNGETTYSGSFANYHDSVIESAYVSNLPAEVFENINESGSHHLIEEHARIKTEQHYQNAARNWNELKFTMTYARGENGFTARFVQMADYKIGYIVVGQPDMLPGTEQNSDDIMLRLGQTVNDYHVSFGEAYNYENLGYYYPAVEGGEKISYHPSTPEYLGFGLIFSKWGEKEDGSYGNTVVVVDYPNQTTVELDGRPFEIEIDTEGNLKLISIEEQLEALRAELLSNVESLQAENENAIAALQLQIEEAIHTLEQRIVDFEQEISLLKRDLESSMAQLESKLESDTLRLATRAAIEEALVEMQSFIDASFEDQKNGYIEFMRDSATLMLQIELNAREDYKNQLDQHLAQIATAGSIEALRDLESNMPEIVMPDIPMLAPPLSSPRDALVAFSERLESLLIKVQADQMQFAMQLHFTQQSIAQAMQASIQIPPVLSQHALPIMDRKLADIVAAVRSALENLKASLIEQGYIQVDEYGSTINAPQKAKEIEQQAMASLTNFYQNLMSRSIIIVNFRGNVVDERMLVPVSELVNAMIGEMEALGLGRWSSPEDYLKLKGLTEGDIGEFNPRDGLFAESVFSNVMYDMAFGPSLKDLRNMVLRFVNRPANSTVFAGNTHIDPETFRMLILGREIVSQAEADQVKASLKLKDSAVVASKRVVESAFNCFTDPCEVTREVVTEYFSDKDHGFEYLGQKIEMFDGNILVSTKWIDADGNVNPGAPKLPYADAIAQHLGVALGDIIKIESEDRPFMTCHGTGCPTWSKYLDVIVRVNGEEKHFAGYVVGGAWGQEPVMITNLDSPAQPINKIDVVYGNVRNIFLLETTPLITGQLLEEMGEAIGVSVDRFQKIESEPMEVCMGDGCAAWKLQVHLELKQGDSVRIFSGTIARLSEENIIDLREIKPLPENILSEARANLSESELAMFETARADINDNTIYSMQINEDDKSTAWTWTSGSDSHKTYQLVSRILPNGSVEWTFSITQRIPENAIILSEVESDLAQRALQLGNFEVIYKTTERTASNCITEPCPSDIITEKLYNREGKIVGFKVLKDNHVHFHGVDENKNMGALKQSLELVRDPTELEFVKNLLIDRSPKYQGAFWVMWEQMRSSLTPIYIDQKEEDERRKRLQQSSIG